MKIRIVTDSTCDLPPDLIKKHQLTVVSLYINIGEESYLDQVEITRREFYQNLPDYRPHPTTSTPGIGAFRQAYEKLALEGADLILSIHITESLSATVDAARKAAEQTTAVPVTVIDSQQLSLGVGFTVLAAAEAVGQGKTLDEILAAVQDQIARTHVAAGLETLEFLRRSGRLNGVVTGLGSLLQLKPILTMHRGVAGSQNVRTTRRSRKTVVNMLKAHQPLEKVALVHANAPETAAVLKEMAEEFLPEGEILSMDITPVIGAHIGPGAAGFAYISAKKET
ncbi:MAG: DegV family protein [Anaerolineales bacterium]|jgi:DegV family protein with EDD domain